MTCRGDRERLCGHLRHAQDMARLGLWELDPVQGTLWWSDEFRVLLRIPAEEPASIEGFLARVHATDRARVAATLHEEALAAGHDVEFSFRTVRPDGLVCHFVGRLRREAAAPPGTAAVLGLIQDVTVATAAEEELRRQTAYLTAILDHMPQGISAFDERLRLQYWNRRFADVLDLPDEALHRDARFEDLIMYPARRGEYGPGDPAQLVAERRALALRFEPHRTERTRPNGRTHLVSGEPMHIDGEVAGFISTYADITEQKRAEAEIRHLAHSDALTGLANRFSLYARLGQAMADARRSGQSLAVLFLDLDRFKTINDSLGHHVGDALLVQVADRLRGCVREADTVARLGGDEFVVALQDVGCAANAAHVAGKLLARLSAPYVVDGTELHAAPSIGISLFPDDCADATGLLRNADAAMYHAKASGRANYQFFTAELNRAATARLILEGKLRRAVERGEFELWYQPLIAACDGTLIGVEALARWRHPQDGLIAPDQFIPLAEETGMITAIGAWVLGEACRQAVRWREQGLGALRVAVNVSARQLRDASFAEAVAGALAASGLEAGALELEITESSIMEQPERAIDLLRALKALGVHIAIDDFGTGYSSLSHLKRFPLDRLKIDRSFVSDIEHDANDAAIVAAAVSVAHNLGLSVVAEGVESAEQVARLRKLGCDVLQGFHFSRPLPAAELAAYIRTHRSGSTIASIPR